MADRLSQENAIAESLSVFRQTSEAYFDAREKLTHALGALVGRRIDITGYPSSTVIASKVDEQGSVLRRTSVPSYRKILTDEDSEPRQPITMIDQTIVDMGPSGLHVAAASMETPKREYDVLGYIFQIQGILQLRTIENIDK